MQLTQGGWERDDAVLIVAVFMVMRMPLAWALRDVIGPLRCAATAYAVAEVLSRRARTLWTSDATAVAPAFKLLSELARVNPTWAGLAAPGVAAGFSFVVRDVIETNYGGKYGVRVSYEEGDMRLFQNKSSALRTARVPEGHDEQSLFDAAGVESLFPSTYAPPTGGGPFLSLQEAGAAQDELSTRFSYISV